MRTSCVALSVLALLAGCAPKDAAPPADPASVPPAASAAGAPDAPGAAGIQSREISYQQGGTTFQGYVAWDSARSGPRPGVIVVHEWWGHNEHARNAARKLARAGYVALALDMYGKGKVTAHPDTAERFMMEALGNAPAINARFAAALAQLKADPHVDSTRIAAIGYCFGGMVVLSLARAGADLDAVASFHGAIPPAAPIAPGSVKARVLILTGGADPMVPQQVVDSFVTAMKGAGANIGVAVYGHAKHSFTNPRADSVGMAALKYDAEADRDSWQELLRMLREVWG